MKYASKSKNLRYVFKYPQYWNNYASQTETALDVKIDALDCAKCPCWDPGQKM